VPTQKSITKRTNHPCLESPKLLIKQENPKQPGSLKPGNPEKAGGILMTMTLRHQNQGNPEKVGGVLTRKGEQGQGNPEKVGGVLRRKGEERDQGNPEKVGGVLRRKGKERGQGNPEEVGGALRNKKKTRRRRKGKKMVKEKQGHPCGSRRKMRRRRIQTRKNHLRKNHLMKILTILRRSNPSKKSSK